MKVEKNWLEWSVFGFSLALILSLVAYLAFDAQTAVTPPVIEIQTGTPRKNAADLIIPVRVVNRGATSAEDVRIEVAVLQEGRAAERLELEIPFLPREGEREGWVVLKNTEGNPALEARLLSYRKP